MHDVSMAVLNTWDFTAKGSQIPWAFMSAITPLLPSIPNLTPSFSACFYLSSVTTLITPTPQLAASVLGITSKA